MILHLYMSVLDWENYQDGKETVLASKDDMLDIVSMTGVESPRLIEVSVHEDQILRTQQVKGYLGNLVIAYVTKKKTQFEQKEPSL